MDFLHGYLRAVGFSSIVKRKDYEKLIQVCAQEATDRTYAPKLLPSVAKEYDDESLLAVYSKDFGHGIGISVCGEYDEDNHFTVEYAFPYLRGTGVTSNEDVSVERRMENISYAGVCDDLNVGITMIFYLQNMIPYLRCRYSKEVIEGTSLTLSALSCKGSIVMPLQKDEKDILKKKKSSMNRSQLIEAAKSGDEEAIESLTLGDIDIYTSISKKIHQNDIYSIVDTHFMPYGVECDLYSILGEILDYELLTNSYTGEEVYRMTILCNELTFDICINKIDLFGEPEVKRRFKGIIWLQGRINFPNEE